MRPLAHRAPRTLHFLAALGLLLVFALTLASMRQSSVYSAAAPDARSPYGVAGVMRWPDWGTFSRPASAMLDTGGSWVREDFVWGLMEPSETVFEWTATDRIVGALAQQHLNILGIISYSTSWASPAKEDNAGPSVISFYPPDNTKYYAFVRALVARYKGSVHYWEVWNEPNNTLFWKPQPNARQYAELLKTAYRAVKDEDPSAKVLTAGMSGNAIPFLEDMVAAGAGNSFDILALHPYAVPENPAEGKLQSRPDVHKLVEVELLKYRAFLQRHGYNRPIWITEIGWPANDWGLDAQAQADYLAQAYAQLLGSGLVERVFWYSFKDDTGSGGESWGLTAWGSGKTDLGPRRPAFPAYATSARMLAFATPLGQYIAGKTTTVDGFEDGPPWTRSSNANGQFTISTEEHYSGQSAAKLEYKFTDRNQMVDFAPPQPIALPGNPVEISLWVRGDDSGNYLSVWLKDRDGELFQVRLGSVASTPDGWRQYVAHINTYYFKWEHVGGNPANGVPDYPLSVTAFRLENTPDELAGSGHIYLDDLQTIDGPDAWVYRFGLTGGQVVDVVWSSGATSVSLATHSTSAQIVDRDGAARTLVATNGTLTVQAGTRPSYIVHLPADGPGAQLSAASISTDRVTIVNPCDAAKRASPLPPDNMYFSATGHNLGGAFRAYWEAHGGVDLFGYPITEEFKAQSSDGKVYVQQFFERARMEYHPENAPPYDVQLGLLGVWTTSNRTFLKSSPPADPSKTLFFPETSHGLSLFSDWWTQHGGLPVFGYPISDEIQEKNASDGKLYTVQYFERNRLEYHPEQNTADQVKLGLLGVEYLGKLSCKP